MKKPLRVLSIDWDYFQVVTSDIIVNDYPDGHDFGTELSIMSWSNHYANRQTEQRLNTVRINKKAYKEIIRAIKRSSDLTGRSCKTMVVNSHKHLYDFIKDTYDQALYDGVDVYNFDMHHDMFTTDLIEKDGQVEYQIKDLDCGNWASHVKKDFNGVIHWVCNEVSDELYPSDLPDEITKDYTCIRDIQFDLVFLCRSDVYSPPHLDEYFDEMRKVIQSYYTTTWLEQGIQEPRDITEHVQEMRKVFDEMTKARVG